jgi:hypothetical protein
MKRVEPAGSLCARVFDRLAEGDDVGGEPELTEHVGSCMACFRVMTDLRDAPRLTAMLRSDPPPLPQSERFWADLAARTTQAAELARATAPSAPSANAPGPGRPRLGSRLRAPAVMFATAALAAAGVLLISRRSPPPPPVTARAPATAVLARTLSDDEAGEGTDVTELDGVALRRLVERLRAGAPGKLTAPVGGDPAEAADLLADDDERVNDALVDLDAPALLRIQRSLARPSL